jgi:polyhydroxyalkanoate synthesis regulator phasin
MNREYHRKHNELSNTTASNLQIHNLRAEIATLRRRIEILEAKLKGE